ncbi:MAG: hypothetical protein GKR89_12300 [Candidatus Latescibacteria bacterium]|nr:hypothetical protein [Candidatus Latescibacterota bacterium]
MPDTFLLSGVLALSTWVNSPAEPPAIQPSFSPPEAILSKMEAPVLAQSVPEWTAPDLDTSATPKEPAAAAEWESSTDSETAFLALSTPILEPTSGTIKERFDLYSALPLSSALDLAQE